MKIDFDRPGRGAKKAIVLKWVPVATDRVHHAAKPLPFLPLQPPGHFCTDSFPPYHFLHGLAGYRERRGYWTCYYAITS